MGAVKKYGCAPEPIVLDMTVSLEVAELEWSEILFKTCDHKLVAAYRERFERLKAADGSPVAAITYTPEFHPEPSAAQEPHSHHPPKKQPMPKTNPHNQSIGARFREARIAAGWNFRGVARVLAKEACLPSKQAVYQIEYGYCEAGRDPLIKFLHLNPAWIESGEGEMFASPPPASPQPGRQASPRPATSLPLKAPAAEPPVIRGPAENKPATRAAPTPQIGLRPRHLVELDRIAEIATAINTRAQAGELAPTEWTEELVERCARYCASSAVNA